MMAAWMLQALVVSLLLALAAALLDALLALYRLPRRGVWVAASIAAVALPLLALLPSNPPAGNASGVTAASPDLRGYTPTTEAGIAATPGGTTRFSLSQAATSVRSTSLKLSGDIVSAAVPAELRHRHATTLVALGWFAISSVLLSLLLLSARRFLRHRKQWREHRLAGTRVYITRNDGPAVVGVRRPAIIVPSWLLALSDEQQRMIVRHEREHVRRGDHILMTSAAVLAALLPWNLPLHWMLARLRLAVELDCDRRVLAAGAAPHAYGAMLIEIAARTHTLPLAVALTRGETELERRIRAMTWKMPAFRPLRAAAGVLSAAVLVLVACDVDMLDPALQNSTIGDVVDAATAAQPSLAAAASGARFFVDGSEVTLDEVRERKLQEFARVDVVKPQQSASGSTEVRMATTAALPAQAYAASIGLVERGAASVSERRAVEVRTAAARAGAGAVVSADSARSLRAVQVDGTRPRIIIDGVLVQPSRAEEVSARAAEVAAQRGVVRLRSDSATISSVLGSGETVRLISGRAVALRDGQVIRDTAATVTIRGAQSITAANRPLFVIDGVIVAGNGFDHVTAADIETIEILKGAAAFSLYGERGANGVVNITTKKR
jgi:TonB-dependent SusC/RagA subfamily outer membrane receptor